MNTPVKEAPDQDISSQGARAAAGEIGPQNTGLSRYWITAILFLGVFAFCVPTIPSADMWWHLSTGRYILQNHSVPHTEPFSATIAGQPWPVHDRFRRASAPDCLRSHAFLLVCL